MALVTAIGDATADGTVTIVESNNVKITYNNIILCLQGALVAPHLTHGSPPIVNTIQAKVFYNNIPFSIYGSVVACGTVIAGSMINPKIFITP